MTKEHAEKIQRIENLSNLRASLQNFAIDYRDIEVCLSALDPEIQSEMIKEEYPFQRSFDEMDVIEDWVNASLTNIDEELLKAQKTLSTKKATDSDWTEIGYGLCVCMENGKTLVMEDHDVVYTEDYIQDLGYDTPADFIKYLVEKYEKDIELLANEPPVALTIEEDFVSPKELENIGPDWDEINPEEEQ